MSADAISRLMRLRGQDVLSAIQEINSASYPPRHKSKSYYLIFKGVKYPQKYAASLATRFASGQQLLPSEFNAIQSIPILKKLGFTIRKGAAEPDGAINGELIGDLYYLSKEIHDGKMTAKDALATLEINRNTARDFFRNFGHLMRGETYRRTLNAEATDYFLEHIRRDYGMGGLKKALEAVDGHLRYYEKQRGGSHKKIREVWRRYTAIASGKGASHDIEGTYDGASPSFRDRPTGTPIDPKVANTLPNAALTKRDQKFLSNTWNKYGMDDFQRLNMDAGNIRRALERGRLEYASGDPATPQCWFRLSAKARTLLESEESLYWNEAGSQTAYNEGEASEVMRTIFKRNPGARADCLRHHGYKCKACKFDFASTYGSIGRDFIHVHHLIEIASIGATYVIDPVKDLAPVCPNCHAMLHQKRPALTIAQLVEHMAEAAANRKLARRIKRKATANI